MKVKQIRIISFILALVMVIPIWCVNPMTAKAATLTLSQLKAKFPQGKYWNHVGSSSNNENGYTSKACTCHKQGVCISGASPCTCNHFLGATQCFGFALKLGYDAYGSNPRNWERAYNLNNIKPGDIINYNGNGHTVFVTKVSGDTVYFGECNYGGRCLISWDRSLKKSQFNNLLNVYVAPKALSNGPHVCSFTGSYFETAHPHKVYQKCSCGKIKYVSPEQHRAYSKCSTCMKLSTAYVTPVKAYTINTGKTTVYSTVNGTAKSNKIYDTDLCTISQIYNCGWCKVTFPLNTGGTETGYCKISVFMKSGGYIIYTSKKINTYKRSDLKTSIGYTGTGDKIYVLGINSSAVQIAYPLTAGGWKVGWIPISNIKYTISYNGNGGTGNMASTSVQYNNKFTLTANKFSKVGHSFDGWNVYRSSDKKWYVSGKGWNTSNDITKNGYTKALYKNQYSSTLSKPWINYGKTSDTFTFYAVWKPYVLNVTYNANGGKINSDSYKLSNNIVYKKSNNEKLVQPWTYNLSKEYGLYNVASFGITKDGYTFKGWGTTASGGTIFDQNDGTLVPTSINSKIKTQNCSSTLYAIWSPKTYSIKYDANGGNGAPTTQTKTHKKNLILSNSKPIKNGYNFLGWSTSKTSSKTTYQPGTTYTDDVSITLYAVWEEIKEDYPYTLGDVNQDGKINVRDATEVQKYIVGLVKFTDEQMLAADADGDGKIQISDATKIMKYITRLINSL